MHSETIKKPIVQFTDNVNFYFDELIETLFWQDYFGFPDSAFQYVLDMKNYIETNIANLPKYPAPLYFSKYQTGMKYVVYQPNNRTAWYLFFLQEDNKYLICYITNNHFEGQFIR
ncbi:MAG: hypothetical protein LBE36_06090 [Flavobacteriaceae bacterium]|jgi:hypothetical protein|nr:hypothetical protein [Flavobacteriaceae bacterium]